MCVWGGPKPVDVLPECAGAGGRREIRKLDRGNRPKSAHLEIALLHNRDRPLSEEGRGEMSVGRQRAASVAMNLLQKEPTNAEGCGDITTTTVTTRPKPPPKAPTTFTRGRAAASGIFRGVCVCVCVWEGFERGRRRAK